MSNIPADLLYTKDHEWVKVHDDGTATVGITDYAQESLGDITFVEFPQDGESFTSGDTFGVVESVKAASDLFMPVDAEVIEINEDVDASPELLNQEPYEGGWLLKIKLQNPEQLDELLKADAYESIV
ncbi:glycine cleavage system protein GcvH [Coraliomargarita sinensis]|uniref:Glycine cleavage system H protein n=1 Tax=Coraliomargarita sinensis TaxID=2174842 RepID=A0A317ZHA2_9BACT|nr:glycine cleavage system protein GcvH [Coraliomargarita sinensis]PXA03189.1 glycine cleavage system protein GcvH [Coraliomargarita sinensis]